MRKILLMLLFSPTAGLSQSEEIDRIAIYLDCSWSCDHDFIKREIPYVDFYRDSKSAHLHIIIKGESSGNGGEKVTFRFVGKDMFDGVNNTLNVDIPANATNEITRTLYVETLEKGLFAYAIRTSAGKNIEIKYLISDTKESVIEKDPWNYWVFRLSVNGFINGEEGYLAENYYSSVRINRITEESKFLSSFNYSNSLTEYSYDDLDLKTNRKSMSFYLTYVKSKGEHFSIGAKTRYTQDTYSNLDASYRLSPCLEYNFLPYSESSEHRLSLLYGVSGTYNNYTDTTVYLKATEFYPSHLIEFTYNNYQTWGSVSIGLDGTQILDKDDMKKYNIRLSTNIDWNITKGLSLSLWSWIDFDRAQIELASNGATYEEVILRQKELESHYFYYMSVGVSYTFGSLKNNFVNPRF